LGKKNNKGRKAVIGPAIPLFPKMSAKLVWKKESFSWHLHTYRERDWGGGEGQRKKKEESLEKASPLRNVWGENKFAACFQMKGQKIHWVD